jgi:ABC-2 type transport system permease protein
LARHTAAAIAIILTYTLLVENVVRAIPCIGSDISSWLPFIVAGRFLTSTDPAGVPIPDASMSPVPSILYFSGIGVALLAVAIVAAGRRDA